jgi:hypothetical protein
VQYAPQLHQPSRTLVVPLLAAVLGAAVATATFALINIEDEAVNVSLPSQAVQSAPPSDAVAGQRNDAGPAEGTAQQIMTPAIEPQGSSAAAAASVAPRYDGGPNEGASSTAMSSESAGAQSAGAAASVAPRYDGGPNEGASSGAMSSESSGPQPYGGMRP